MKKDSYFKWFYVMLIGILDAAINYGFRELPEVLLVLNVSIAGVAAYKIADQLNYIQSMLNYIDNLGRQAQVQMQQDPTQQEKTQSNVQTSKPIIQTPNKPSNPVGYLQIYLKEQS